MEIIFHFLYRTYDDVTDYIPPLSTFLLTLIAMRMTMVGRADLVDVLKANGLHSGKTRGLYINRVK